MTDIEASPEEAIAAFKPSNINKNRFPNIVPCKSIKCWLKTILLFRIGVHAFLFSFPSFQSDHVFLNYFEFIIPSEVSPDVDWSVV